MRISVNPQAIRCIRCQTWFEKKHDTRLKIDEMKSSINTVKRKLVKVKKLKRQ